MAFLDDIVWKLVRDGVGTIGASTTHSYGIYTTTQAKIPGPEVGDGPYLILVETGGTGSVRNQNDTGTERPTAQLKARAASYLTAREMLMAAYLALGGANGLYNVSLNGVFYLSVTARQLPTDTGKDEHGRATITFNIDAEKEPS